MQANIYGVPAGAQQTVYMQQPGVMVQHPAHGGQVQYVTASAQPMHMQMQGQPQQQQMMMQQMPPQAQVVYVQSPPGSSPVNTTNTSPTPLTTVNADVNASSPSSGGQVMQSVQPGQTIEINGTTYMVQTGTTPS